MSDKKNNIERPKLPDWWTWDIPHESDCPTDLFNYILEVEFYVDQVEEEKRLLIKAIDD